MFVIPYDRLPPGFGERIDQPPADPAPAGPAATVVLLRDGAEAMEVLLLKRHRSSGFVPGAYVFPGGRVDAADAQAELATHLDHVPDPLEPPLGYWMAAVREVFEETGVLLANTGAVSAAEIAECREQLLADAATLHDVLVALRARPCLASLAYCAHWITPLAEPRRFDTRFFAAKLPSGAEVRADEREMEDARWLTPDDALAQFQHGALPMVFPTVRTVEMLRGYTSVEEALTALRARTVTPILPRLVRTAEGVAIAVDS